MKTVKDLPKHLRPREKLLEKGATNLKDHELLAILLRTGREGKSVLQLAKQLLKKFPKEKLLAVTLKDLTSIKGIGKDKAATILAAFELTKRAINHFDDNLPLIQSPQDAMNHLTELKNLKKEFFVCLYLNARNQLIHKETISIGTLTASLVHPREVFAPAIKYHAAALILAHNHPSGNLTPSSEDKKITDTLIKSGELLDIKVIDHLLVNNHSFVSFKSEGYF